MTTPENNKSLIRKIGCFAFPAVTGIAGVMGYLINDDLQDTNKNLNEQLGTQSAVLATLLAPSSTPEFVIASATPTQELQTATVSPTVRPSRTPRIIEITPSATATQPPSPTLAPSLEQPVATSTSAITATEATSSDNNLVENPGEQTDESWALLARDEDNEHESIADIKSTFEQIAEAYQLDKQATTDRFAFVRLMEELGITPDQYHEFYTQWDFWDDQIINWEAATNPSNLNAREKVARFKNVYVPYIPLLETKNDIFMTAISPNIESVQAIIFAMFLKLKYEPSDAAYMANAFMVENGIDGTGGFEQVRIAGYDVFVNLTSPSEQVRQLFQPDTQSGDPADQELNRADRCIDYYHVPVDQLNADGSIPWDRDLGNAGARHFVLVQKDKSSELIKVTIINMGDNMNPPTDQGHEEFIYNNGAGDEFTDPAGYMTKDGCETGSPQPIPVSTAIPIMPVGEQPPQDTPQGPQETPIHVETPEKPLNEDHSDDIINDEPPIDEFPPEAPTPLPTAPASKATPFEVEGF